MLMKSNRLLKIKFITNSLWVVLVYFTDVDLYSKSCRNLCSNNAEKQNYCAHYFDVRLKKFVIYISVSTKPFLFQVCITLKVLKRNENNTGFLRRNGSLCDQFQLFNYSRLRMHFLQYFLKESPRVLQ